MSTSSYNTSNFYYVLKTSSLITTFRIYHPPFGEPHREEWLTNWVCKPFVIENDLNVIFLSSLLKTEYYQTFHLCLLDWWNCISVFNSHFSKWVMSSNFFQACQPFLFLFQWLIWGIPLCYAITLQTWIILFNMITFDL